MVKLVNIALSKDGTKLIFDYSVNNSIQKYLNTSDKLFVDYPHHRGSHVPESLDYYLP